MTWSKKDIIADIKKQELDVNIDLPYWELRQAYRRARYTRDYIATGSFGFAKSRNSKSPQATKECDK